MTIEALAAGINETTGWTGKELMAATFIAAAVWCDVNGRKDIGDYYIGRLKEVTATKPKESKR